jgi:hypothetical protein
VGRASERGAAEARTTVGQLRARFAVAVVLAAALLIGALTVLDAVT